MPHNQIKRDLVKCEDMRLFAERAIRYLGAATVEEFASDEVLQAAVVRCVSVVGEAANRVSKTAQARFSEVPWSAIIGMRNVLIHDYVEVDPFRVFAVVTGDLPRLVEALNSIRLELEKEIGWED